MQGKQVINYSRDIQMEARGLDPARQGAKWPATVWGGGGRLLQEGYCLFSVFIPVLLS